MPCDRFVEARMLSKSGAVPSQNTCEVKPTLHSTVAPGLVQFLDSSFHLKLPALPLIGFLRVGRFFS